MNYTKILNPVTQQTNRSGYYLEPPNYMALMPLPVWVREANCFRSSYQGTGLHARCLFTQNKHGNQTRQRRCLKPEEQGLDLGPSKWMDNNNEVWWPCAWETTQLYPWLRHRHWPIVCVLCHLLEFLTMNSLSAEEFDKMTSAVFFSMQFISILRQWPWSSLICHHL